MGRKLVLRASGCGVPPWYLEDTSHTTELERSRLSAILDGLASVENLVTAVSILFLAILRFSVS